MERLFVRLLESRNVDVVGEAESIARWIEATKEIEGVSTRLLANAWGLAAALYGGETTLDHLGDNAAAHRRALDGEDAPAALGCLELALAQLERLPDDHVADWISKDTMMLRAMLETLRDEPRTPLAKRLRALFPNQVALARSTPSHLSVEQEPSPETSRPFPLLDHLSDRCLGRKLAGLEAKNLALFQKDDALGAGAFAVTSGVLDRICEAGLLPVVRIALAFLDFAKGGAPHERDHWEALGADLTIHNLAARTIVESTEALHRFPILRGSRTLERLCLILIETHGLAGQAVRGETPLALFAPFARFLREEVPALADHLQQDQDTARRRVVDCLHLIDVCDTAAVREGLLTDALHRELVEVEEAVLAAAAEGQGDPVEALSAEEAGRWHQLLPQASGEERARARLVDRLARLRAGRIAAGEPVAAVEAVVAALSARAIERLAALMARCQLWYAESATGGLSAKAQVTLLALGLRAAEETEEIDTTKPFHMSLLPLVERLGEIADRAVDYRRRLMETALSATSVEDALEGTRRPAGDAVVTLRTEIGGASAVALTSQESDEARALLTLLPIYERKSSAAFHATLKSLCDLYGLRKDEFDRVANEEMYLAHMNSARSDKARMLDYAKPGRIVEIGPGGGVILDLLEERFAGSEVIGIDSSRMVVEALEKRRTEERRRWTILEADAYAIEDYVGVSSVDTVIFCSVLHEIYSYVEHEPDDGGPPRRFTLEAVRDLLRAAFATIVPGGRMLIRDGVMPPSGVRVLRFIEPHARELFELFVEQFEGRRIRSEAVGEDAVRLSAADAMEFLYTYTWGPQSFPYEVREQYGVLPYDEYVQKILSWLGPNARAVPLSPHVASYLQKGYEEGLRDRVELLDEAGRPTRLPDSNCLIVVERVDPL